MAKFMEFRAPPIFVLALLYVVFGGCGPKGGTKPLPNDYALHLTDKGVVLVQSPDFGVLEPQDLDRDSVEAIASVGDIVAGRTKTHHFAVDTRTGRHSRFADRAGWEQALATSYGTPAPPELRPVGRFLTWGVLFWLILLSTPILLIAGIAL